MTSYRDFLAKKLIRFEGDGISVAEADLHPELFPFQRAIVLEALSRGRACIFADTGLGKTLMQLEWARHIPGRVLLVAPLAVTKQTEAEAKRFGFDAACQREAAGSEKITITNYERVERFDLSEFAALVLDESSILKSYDGAFCRKIIATASELPYRLACTATPAPNDHIELGTHAEFVGAMSRSEMLALFFVHDGGSTQDWRLKGHARREFWAWLRSWATVVTKPSDLGFSDDGFILPALNVTPTVVGDHKIDGALFPEAVSLDLNQRRSIRRQSITDRVDYVARMVATEPGEQWILWCDLNEESRALSKFVPGAVEVTGSDEPEEKAEALLAFARGEIRVLVTKPRIAGFGLNLQNCARMVFVGMSDSYEAYYQAIRRCWRFGQKRPVDVRIVVSRPELQVVENVRQKADAHERMKAEMTKGVIGSKRQRVSHTHRVESGPGWEMHLGDACEVVAGFKDESVDYSVFSPPFASLYVYSDHVADMGNCRDVAEFSEHFRFLLRELIRVLVPGRLMSMHCMLLPTSKVRDGVIGLQDFRGDLIRLAQEAGFVFHSEVVIWKDPVTAMQRTKALGLLHKQIRKDSAMSRQGIPDYVITMRKPGENPKPIAHDATEFPVTLWQKWASPIWMDINPSDTLQRDSAREEADERHIAPLQLEVIRRCLGLWSNRGDLVLSPFAGIGSEGFEALRWGRRFIGVELKKSYFDQAVANLRGAVEETKQVEMFR